MGALIDTIEDQLARDPRRVVCHNDVNPGNVLWDGTRAWLVDWEVAGLGHPYFDLASFTTFLNLDTESALGLLALLEQGPVDATARASFVALRRLVALVAGCVFLGLASDLSEPAAPTRADAPSLATVYAGLREGTLDLQTSPGRVAFGLALLRIGTEMI